MNATRDDYVLEALTTGTLRGLPAGHFIAGRSVRAARGATMEVFDPGTGKAFAEVAAGTGEDVEAAVAAARRAFDKHWKTCRPVERGRILQRTGELITKAADRLAVVEALDSGKPLRDAVADVAGAARCFEYYAGACDKLQGDSIPLGPDYLAYTVNEPVGVAAQIVPWNFPLSTLARGLAPALAAGCTVVAKPAEQTPMSALILAELLAEAGLPEGVYNVVTGTGRDAGAPLVAHPDVDHVTFTGSVETGMEVMAAAARNITRVTLELGGKSPLAVCADCDREQALEGALGAIFEHAGQVCSAGSRLLVERTIRDDFVGRLAERAGALTLGHGLRDPGLGPVNSPAQLERIEGYVNGAAGRQAQIVTGGARTTDPDSGLGWFFQPTIIDRVAPDDPVVQEEIFGPVLVVQSFDDWDEAVALANGTPYGLVAGIYTGSLEKAQRFVRDVDAGQVYVNEYFAGGIEVPFGGTKRSGFGREKGLEALRNYCQVKSAVIRI